MVCGLLVPAAELRLSDVEGLRGLMICPYCCDGMDRRLSYRDRRRLNPQDYETVGNGRVYPPGGAFDFYDPRTDLFSPLLLGTPRLWLRNQAIPRATVGVWGAALHDGVFATSDEGTVSVSANPFGTGARGAVFETDTDSLAFSEEVLLTGIFTIALAFRTGASLATTGINLLRDVMPGSSTLEIGDDGALEASSATASGTLLAATSFVPATNYVLTVLRTGANAMSARKNGATAPGSSSIAGNVALSLLHDHLSNAVTFAEVLIFEKAVVGDELTALERYLARIVGVTL